MNFSITIKLLIGDYCVLGPGGLYATQHFYFFYLSTAFHSLEHKNSLTLWQLRVKCNSLISYMDDQWPWAMQNACDQ